MQSGTEYIKLLHINDVINRIGIARAKAIVADKNIPQSQLIAHMIIRNKGWLVLRKH